MHLVLILCTTKRREERKKKENVAAVYMRPGFLLSKMNVAVGFTKATRAAQQVWDPAATFAPLLISDPFQVLEVHTFSSRIWGPWNSISGKPIGI